METDFAPGPLIVNPPFTVICPPPMPIVPPVHVIGALTARLPLPLMTPLLNENGAAIALSPMTLNAAPANDSVPLPIIVVVGSVLKTPASSSSVAPGAMTKVPLGAEPPADNSQVPLLTLTVPELMNGTV